VRKRLEALPLNVQQGLQALIEVLETGGPTAPYRWKNYGKLKGMKNKFHCHLSADHRFVACWQLENDRVTIEVYYVGSHKDAPY